jgi:hypothetical protein
VRGVAPGAETNQPSWARALGALGSESTSGSGNENLRTALQTEAGPDRHALLTKRRKPTRRRYEIALAATKSGPLKCRLRSSGTKRRARPAEPGTAERKEKQILPVLSAEIEPKKNRPEKHEATGKFSDLEET